LQDLRIAGRSDVDAIASRVCHAAASGASLPPDAARLLLRLYLAGHDDLGDTLGLALARALDAASVTSGAAESARWLMLFAEASPIADDDRIRSMVGALSDRLRAAWPFDAATADGFAAGAATVEACLCAARIADAQTIVPPAIDELERIVAGAYRPGKGVCDGDLVAHVSGASALLTAFEGTGRLPYSMLAEELTQPLRRAPAADFATGCAAARVLCRLAALHADREYRTAAVIAPDADYQHDAAQILQSFAAAARTAPLGDASLYGLAFGELISLR
jgi:hypothetical protein